MLVTRKSLQLHSIHREAEKKYAGPGDVTVVCTKEFGRYAYLSVTDARTMVKLLKIWNLKQGAK